MPLRMYHLIEAYMATSLPKLATVPLLVCRLRRTCSRYATPSFSNRFRVYVVSAACIIGENRLRSQLPDAAPAGWVRDKSICV
jgi:hypothetical protein